MRRLLEILERLNTDLHRRNRSKALCSVVLPREPQKKFEHFREWGRLG